MGGGKVGYQGELYVCDKETKERDPNRTSRINEEGNEEREKANREKRRERGRVLLGTKRVDEMQKNNDVDV